MNYINYKLNRMRLVRILARKFLFNIAVENTSSKYSYVYFAEQHIVNLDLRALELERMNKSCGGVEIKSICESISLYFYLVGSLPYLLTEPDPRYI